MTHHRKESSDHDKTNEKEPWNSIQGEGSIGSSQRGIDPCWIGTTVSGPSEQDHKMEEAAFGQGFWDIREKRKTPGIRCEEVSCQDGTACDGERFFISRSRTHGLPLPLTGTHHLRGESRVVHGHMLHPHGEVILLYHGHYGMSRQEGAVLAAFKHVRHVILYWCTWRGNRSLWNATDIRYRSRESIHLWQIHRDPQEAQHQNKYGWARPLDGKRVHREALVEHKIWRHTSQGIRFNCDGEKGTDQLVYQVQHVTTSSRLDNRTPDAVYWSMLPRGKGCSMNEGGSSLRTCSNLSRIPRPSLG